MVLRRAIGPAVVAAILCVALPTHASGSLESQVFSLINGARSKALVVHSGLASAARAHSQQMAMSGGLNHDGADERVANAPPDPAEGNGAPDDGFGRAAWCENVTYSTGFPESQVARKLYEQWHRSAAHNGCMTNPNKNVGAVGIYYDGSTWWATFIAEADSTPPGGAAPAPPPAQKAPATQPAAPAAREEAPASRQPAASGFTGQTAAATSIVPGSRPADITAPANTEPSAATTATHDGDPTAGAAVSAPSLIDLRGTLTRPLLARHGRDPLPVDSDEIAGLVCVALFALWRLERRNRPKRLRSANVRLLEPSTVEITYAQAV